MKNNDNTAQPIKPRDTHESAANSGHHGLHDEVFRPPATAAERREALRLADATSGNRSQPLDFSADHLKRVVEHTIGRTDLGTKVPDEAATLPGFKVDKRVKCATTGSTWLVEMGMMSNREFQLKVDDFANLLPTKGFRKQEIHGKLDPRQFPEGPIGFIVGQGLRRDGSNHIAYAERRGDNIRIVHNDAATGRIVDEKLQDVFYDKSGLPRFEDLSLFVLPRRQPPMYARNR